MVKHGEVWLTINHDPSSIFQRSPTENSQKSRLRTDMNSPLLTLINHLNN
jgi:hypothetical protein